MLYVFFFFFSSRRRHTRCSRDWSSDVCSSDLDVKSPMRVVVIFAILLSPQAFGSALFAEDRDAERIRSIEDGLRRDRASWLEMAVRMLEREIPAFSTGEPLERRVMGQVDAAIKAMQ